MSHPNQIVVDDEDPQVKFAAGTWDLNASWQGAFNETAHWTRTAGSTVNFTFTGTSVAVYGIINPTGPRPISTYVVDGGSPSTYTGPDTTTFLYQFQFYQSSTLSDGQHTLVVTDIHNTSFFLIDYILYTPSSEVTTTPPASQPTSPASPTKNVLNSHAHTTAIAGAAAGGAVFVIAALMLLFFLCRRRRWQHLRSDPNRIMEPYVQSPTLPVLAAGISKRSENDTYNARTGRNSRSFHNASSDPIAPEYSQAVTPAGVARFVSAPGMLTRTTEATSNQTAAAFEESWPRFHEDGGVRLQGGSLRAIDAPEDDVPPIYGNFH